MQTRTRGDQQFMHGAKVFLCNNLRSLAIAGLVLTGFPFLPTTTARGAEDQEIRIAELQGTVEIMPEGAKTWVLTQTNQVLHPGDRARTGVNSRATLRWSDQSVVPFGALTEIEILSPPSASSLPGLHLLQGVASFFHRDQPGRIRVITHGATASIEGTEFVIEAGVSNGVESATFYLIDGKVVLANELGSLTLTNNQSAVIETGRAPSPAPGFIANNVLQWCFYYPAVLDPRELEFSTEERQALGGSLTAYRDGDLPQALAKYPTTGQPQSDTVRVYLAALLLSVGEVAGAENTLAAMTAAGEPENLRREAEALRTLIAAVKHQTKPAEFTPQLATEFLAASYYEQSRASGEDSLRAARESARQAVRISPEFGFARARLAELEFGFGQTRAAAEALRTSLELSPRNAQAIALNGFILAAQGRTAAALQYFNRSLAVDAALGNAWLGRGLCRIREGARRGGRDDLLVAAALEPQRALLRSYLGKAYADHGDGARADRELKLALKLDPCDPTGWLYRALLEQQENRINEAVKDLQTSQDLNDNRNLFRSRLLLDQDQAVRSASLAKIYRDAGLEARSVAEAARAVSYDYENHSAHQFLAESYDALRDPTRFNLRYETVWFNELLLANLLSPVGAGVLSQNISQQEYSRLFASDGLSILSSTEYRSDGQVREIASQSGAFGHTSYSLDLDYQHNDGVRVNNDLNRIDWYTQIKQQLTPADSLFLLAKFQDYDSGDNFQYYNPTNARPDYRLSETQKPLVLAALRHEWSPGIYTTLLAGRLQNEQLASDRQAPGVIILQDAAGGIASGFQSFNFDLNYRSDFTTYLGEVNQVVEAGAHTFIFGGRLQEGRFDTQATLFNPAAFANFFPNPPADTTTSEGFYRLSLYAYDNWRPFDQLVVTLGLGYDDMRYPANFRSPPIAPGQDNAHALNPKAAVIWTPVPRLALRGAYAKSLGGVSYDESFRLEPVQLAGFVQSFRSLISESLVGELSGQKFEIRGAGLNWQFCDQTYLDVEAQWLSSAASGPIGVFYDNFQSPALPQVFPGSLQRSLDYQERSVKCSLTKLAGKEWAIGANYRLTYSRLQTDYPQMPLALEPNALTTQSATLHQLGPFVQFNHPCGFFARAEANWYEQSNRGYTPAEPGNSFVQVNMFAGWRLMQRRVEATVGLLNAGGGDYNLNPLNPYMELPRKRVFLARVGINF